MITLTFDATGFELDELDQRLDNFEAPIAAVLEEALLDASHTIRVTKDEWAPMAASTIKGGRDPSSLLVKSGELADSLARGGPGNVFQAGASSGIAGSSLPRASYQQHGQGAHPARPPRAFLLWSEERSDDYVEIFRRHLLGE